MVLSSVKSSIMQDFRTELGTAGAPSSFEDTTPISPIAIVAGNIGLPKPRSNQRIKTYFFSHTSTTAVQIETVSSTKKYYLLGVVNTIVTGAGGSVNSHIFDRTSGTGRTTGDTDIPLFRTVGTASTTVIFSDIFNYPVEMKIGIRLYTAVAASSSAEGVVYYLEEDVIQ